MNDSNERHSIYGSELRDIIRGNGGDDTIYGEGGNDYIVGGSGDDYLQGGEGNDSYVYNLGDGDDYIYDEGGSDTIRFGTGILRDDVIIDSDGYSLYFHVGTNTITAESQFDTYSPLYGIERAVFADGASINLPSVNDIVGSSSNDSALYGTADNDYIYGFSGNDILRGGAGADVLDGGQGTDRVSYLDASEGLRAYLGNTSKNTGDAVGDIYISIENLQGSRYNDVLVGDSGNNRIWGHNGNDSIWAGNGNDILIGQNGDDRLFSGKGSDNLYGGNGADSFMFRATDINDGIDQIRDFDLSEGDVLNLSHVLEEYDPLVDAITDFVRITNNNGDSILSVDIDGGADSFQQIATIHDVTGLTNEEQLETNGTLIV